MLADYLENKPVIQTENLILRPMTISDVPALKEWTANKELYKYWGKSAGKSDKDPSLLFSANQKPTLSFHLGIELKSENKIIGEIWIYLIEYNRMAKLAYRISEDYKGHGYSTEAVKSLIKFCFEKTELQRIWTDVDVRNIASVKVLEKCGFTREGLVRQGRMVSTWCDYYLYAILKQDVTQ